MNQPTTDKIRQIIMDQYECGDIFTPASTLTGTILGGDDTVAYDLSVAIEREFLTRLPSTDWYYWQTVQDVFDSVEAAL